MMKNRKMPKKYGPNVRETEKIYLCHFVRRTHSLTARNALWLVTLTGDFWFTCSLYFSLKLCFTRLHVKSSDKSKTSPVLRHMSDVANGYVNSTNTYWLITVPCTKSVSITWRVSNYFCILSLNNREHPRQRENIICAERKIVNDKISVAFLCGLSRKIK